MPYAERLIEVRRIRNWSQRKLAAELGVSNQAVNGWERGQQPSKACAEKIDALLADNESDGALVRSAA